METVACKALEVFVESIPNYGMVVGNPDDKSVNVPEKLVERLVDEGKIKAPKGFKPTVAAINDVGGASKPGVDDIGDDDAPAE
jgi:hypothetical protein